MARVAVAAAVVIALAAGVWLLWPEDEPAPTTTLPVAGSSTTDSPTTSSPPSTTSTTEDSHLVETVEEAEAILRDLWFGWFEGIYDQDEDRIREVVYSEEQVEAASRLFGSMAFTQAPSASGIHFLEVRILQGDMDCLAVWSISRALFLEQSPQRSGVDIFRWIDEKWMFFSSWSHEQDLWESDCGPLPG